MASDWTPDFCLVCDQQTPGNEVYCSQGCRLADLDQDFTASSLKHSVDSQHKSVYRRQSAPAPVDQAPSLKITTGRRQAISKNSSRSHYDSSGSSQSSSLESSSSLLASSSSSSSNQIKHELHDYTGYFDPVRDWKRRQMSS